jgi:hypothetical protein
MRNSTRFSPSLGSLESRELLSSLPEVAGAIQVRVEKVNAKRVLIKGTLMLTEKVSPTPDEQGVFIFDFYTITGGTGTVKPFGRVHVVDSGGMPSQLVTSNLAEFFGAIFLADAQGQTVGQIYVLRGFSRTFTFQVRRSKVPNGPRLPPNGQVVGGGNATLVFPNGAPISGGPAVPFTITL